MTAVDLGRENNHTQAVGSDVTLWVGDKVSPKARLGRDQAEERVLFLQLA
jgi:hypothetical protein